MFSNTNSRRLLAAAASLVFAATAFATGPINKCVINGSITFQQSPCPPDGVIRRPTVQELNAAEKKKRAAVAGAAASNSASAKKFSRFTCDERKMCTQMTSCLEAKYFLAHCPGVKMDGDGDGIPCEQQWCHP